MTTRFDNDHELDQRLRRTLAAVADTVHEDPVTNQVSPSRRSRGRRRLIVGAGTTIVAIPLAAAAMMVGFGPEHVDQIPPADPIISGSLDGERYWVVDGRDIPQCEGHPSGIETMAEESNIVGQEWNTFGSFFGEPTADGGCAPQVADSPPDYTYFSDGGQMIGDGMLWVGALHPDVDQVRVSLDGDTPFDAATFEHEEGTYYVLEVPPGTATFTVDYLIDGEVVPAPAGESAEHTVPSN